MRRLLRTLVLGLILGVAALVVPDSAVKSTEVALVKVQRAESVDAGSDVIWILAVGSDARPGENMLRVRGDALQMVGLNTKTGAATSIGIPRDSYVSIPGVGSDRINAALYYGGPEALGEAAGDMRAALRFLSMVLIATGILCVIDAALTVLWQEPVTAIYGKVRQDELGGELNKLNGAALLPSEQSALKELHASEQRIAFLARSMRRRDW